MFHIKKLYNNNSIFQFWTSYLSVLIIPLIIVFFGFQYVFHVVKEDANTTNITMLEHSMNLIDIDLSSVESIAVQASQSSKLLSFSKATSLTSEKALLANSAMNEIFSLINFHGVNLIDDAYIYCKNTNYIMFENTLYKPSIFKRYITKWGMDYDEWYDLCINNSERIPFYISTNNSLQYILPFTDTLKGESLGVIVLHLDSQKLKYLLDFSNKFDDYALYIKNSENEIIWFDHSFINKTITVDSNVEDLFEEQTKNTHTINLKSSKTGWHYYLVVPEKEVYKELNILKNLIFILIFVAVLIGVIFSLYLSFRAGRPINDIFRRLGQKENSPRNSAKLGEIVSDILRSNQQYVEDLEKDKPLLQKAFFHDLIKAEFVSTTELRYMAEKSGISITSQTYTIVALKLFANNDFYEVDDQTIEDVRILMQVVTDYFNEISKTQVWFYKKDYLTTLAVFLGNHSADEITSLVEQVYDWISSTYSVETRWGLSNISNDLLNVWKMCEEAMTAVDNCNATNHIVQYDSQLENITEFYFPDMAKESLKNCIQYGDVMRLHKVLNIIQEENFEKRSLNRNRFLKLNAQIVSLLSEFCDSTPELKEQIMSLNAMVIEYDENAQEKYFLFLNNLCEFLCQETTKKIHIQRGKLVINIRSYINDNYMDSNLGLAKISSVFGISEGYVSSIFKEQDGVNFADYVEQLRIEKACQLLKDGNYKITDISSMVGYNSVQTFRRAFKRVLGIKPTEYRQE